MPNDIRSLVNEHHVFYEVSPYYVVLQERHRGLSPTARRVQAGFDVDVYSQRIDDDGPWTPPHEKYEVGYAQLQRIAEDVSRHAPIAAHWR
jgi:hypothetical protein